MVKESVKRCSHCGKDGHNLRTCIENDKECLMLFGVNILQKKQITGESMKKSCSMINISSCDIENKNGDKEDPEAGYLSDGLVHSKRRKATHDRRKGKAWTEEEHRVFLSGLKQLGKGDWKGISRSFVTTRTPTQVASHAQKYFLRLGAHEKKRRRPSLFDIPLSLSHQNETHKDSRDLPLRKTFKSSLEPRSSQIMTTTSTVEKTRQQSIDKNKMVNQFPHLCMDDSTAIPVAASTCFQNYEVLTSTVKRPSHMYFAHFAFPKPAVYPHLPKIHGNLDVFPVISHPSGIPSPQYPVSRSSSQGSHGESQSHPGRQSAHFRTTAPLV